MFGDCSFGDAVFGGLDCVGSPSPARQRGLIGGSGFPEGWQALLNQQPSAADVLRRQRDREEEEVAALVLAGVL